LVTDCYTYEIERTNESPGSEMNRGFPFELIGWRERVRLSIA
jgi:hypothetical protein